MDSLGSVNPALASLRAMARHMTRGVDEETREAFRQLLRTQDPRWRPEDQTKVILPARWQKSPEALPGLERLEGSVFMRRNMREDTNQYPAYCPHCDEELSVTEGECAQCGQKIVPREPRTQKTSVLSPNGFKNRDSLFTHFRQEKITGQEPAATEAEAVERGRLRKPIVWPSTAEAATRSQSAPDWCVCPTAASDDGTHSCSDGRTTSARNRPISVIGLRRATNEILVCPPKVEKKKKGKKKVDQSLELRRTATWNAWLSRRRVESVLRPMGPVPEEIQSVPPAEEAQPREKENIPPDWDTDWDGAINFMGNGDASRAVYAQALARELESGREVTLKVMMDPGNVTRRGIVISRDFQKRLGVGFKKIAQGKVGTAGQGKSMKKLGVSKPFTLQLYGLRTSFEVTAEVIEDLVDDMNVGTAFFQKVAGSIGGTMAMEFVEKGTQLRIGDEVIELVNTMNDDRKGLRVLTPEAINKPTEQVDQMAEDGWHQRCLGVGASTEEIIECPVRLPENKGITWAVHGSEALPWNSPVVKPPEPVLRDMEAARHNQHGGPPAGILPWYNLQGEPTDDDFTRGIKITGVTKYPAEQVVAAGPSCVKLMGPDGRKMVEYATVGGRGRSLTIKGKTPKSRARIRRTASNAQAQCFPIKTIRGCYLEPHSITFVEIPKIRGTAMVEPMPTDAPHHCMLVNAVYDGTDKVAVVNMHDEALSLPKDTEVGYCIPLQHKRMVVEPDAEGKVDPLEHGLTKGVNNLNDCGDDPKVALADPEELYKDLKLEENPMLTKNPGLMKKVKDLVTEYRDIFSCPDQLIGKTTLCEFSIELTPNAQPHKAKLRPLNPKQKESLKEQLAKWQQGPKEDWIAEECESPWAAALVPVQKKSGETRWAVDYRPLNAVTVKDSYPLPNIQENLEKLQGSKIFSTLDAAGAYHTIPVAEASKPLLAFTTPFGLYSFNRMPFGPTNSGQCYTRFMEMLVAKLRSPYTLAYVDDLIVHTPDLGLQMDELRRVFEMHRQAGIRLGAKKTTLFAEEADYLGYKVTANGMKMQDRYVEKVLNWPKPETGKALASFLGFAGYYRSFIPGFAYLTSEMSSQKKEKTVTWTEEMSTKFEKLRKLFGMKPIRAYPQYGPDDEPFEVWPDFSHLALGFVIQQVQKKERRLIAAGGRKTTKGEQNYAPTKGELAAIVHALRKFEHILRYRPFVIYTDHAALKWLKTMKNPRGIFFRWLQELSSYEFEIHHVPGKSTGAADGLSRSSHLPDPTPEEEAESLEFVGHVGDLRADEVLMPDEGILEAVRWNRAGLKQAQEEDEVLILVKRWVKGARMTKEERRGLPQDAQAYYKQLGVLDVDEGDTLIRCKASGAGTQQIQQILIPANQKIRDEVFKWSHAHPSAGHFGIEATAARAMLKFYWPGIYSDMRKWVTACETCLAKQQKVQTTATVHVPRRHGYPGEILYVDLVGPMPKSHKDNLFICTMQDGFSKFVSATMIPCKEAPVVANAVLEGWITKFGCPDQIHTDQGTEFKNKLWKDLMDRLQIEKTETPPYNPQSNLVERFHRVMNAIMRCYMDRGDRNWESYIPMCCFAYNTKINSTTGVTPFEAFLGRPAKLPIDLVIPAPQKVYGDENEFIKETERRFQTMYAYMKERSEAGFRRTAKLYSGNPDHFQEGDLCWVFTKRKVEGKPQKITDAWLGPYRVLGKPAACLLKVEPADVDGRSFVVHMSRVRRFRGAQVGNKHRPPKEPLVADMPDEAAEEIGGPEQWVEPTDALVVPIQAPPEPVEMQDIMPPPPIPAKKHADASKHKNAKTKQADAWWQSGKRVRSPTDAAGSDGEAGPSGKKLRSSNEEKRQGDTTRAQPNKQVRREGTPIPKPKSKWTDLLTDESGEEPMGQDPSDESDNSSDSDTMETIRKLEELVVKVPPGTRIPEKASPQAAGWDCRATQSITLEPGRIAKVPIGLRLDIPEGWCGMLLSRPKLAAEGIAVEATMVCREQHEPILCILCNRGPTARRIQSGERICQLVFVPVPSINWVSIQQSSETEHPQDDAEGSDHQ